MKKTPKTMERMQEVEAHLLCYEESITRLYAFSKGEIKLKDRHNQRTREDEIRMQWTLKNIKLQMQLLRHELTVLMEYGA